MNEEQRIFYAPENNQLNLCTGWYCWLENSMTRKWITSGPFDLADEAKEQLRLTRAEGGLTMGADYRSFAIIGIKIDAGKLYTPKIVKAFPHNHPKTMKFDPQTGKELWREDGEAIAGYDESKDTIMGYKILKGTDHRSYFAALASAGQTTDSNGGADEELAKLDLTILSTAKQVMKNRLDPLGLWNEKEFGLWAVLYCSY